MADTTPPPPPGTILWRDLTIPPDKMEAAKGFYETVVGWTLKPHNMGEYDDFELQAGGETKAGLCNARGTNADMPAQWMTYVQVADVDASCQQATANGGSVVVAPRMMGGHRFAVVQDPAGAVLGIMSSVPESA